MRIRRLIRSGAVATSTFLVFCWLTTQVQSLRVALPFTDDPWDAVTSFAVIGIAVIGGATVVRAIGQRERAGETGATRRIAVGVAISVVIGAVALASDVVAVLVVPSSPDGLAQGPVLAMLAVPVAATTVALAALWQARDALRQPAPTVEPDLLDAVDSIVSSIGAAGLARSFSAWVETSRFSPRRHRVLVGVLGGIAAGVGASAWHALREGGWASPAAAVVFGGLIAAGVTGAYLLGLEPLRLLRSPAVTTRTS